MDGIIAEIKSCVPTLLDEIRQEAGEKRHNFCCHEYAFLLAKKLRVKFGDPVKVRDGYAVYNRKFIEENFLKPEEPKSTLDLDGSELSDLFNSMRSQVAMASGKMNGMIIQHSWCELRKKIVVDYHVDMTLESKCGTIGLSNVLRVGAYQDLADQTTYVSGGLRFSLGKLKLILLPVPTLPLLFRPWRCLVKVNL